jgi:hypothetical protein
VAKKKKQPKQNFLKILLKDVSLWWVLLVLLLFLGVLLFGLWSRYFYLKTETEYNIVKTLPREVSQKLKYASPAATFRVPVLMYHYVEYVKDPKDTIRKSLSIDPYTFEQEIKTLKEAKWVS